MMDILIRLKCSTYSFNCRPKRQGQAQATRAQAQAQTQAAQAHVKAGSDKVNIEAEATKSVENKKTKKLKYWKPCTI